MKREPTERDSETEEVGSSWERFFELTRRFGVPDDFLVDRHNGPPQQRRLFTEMRRRGDQQSL